MQCISQKHSKRLLLTFSDFAPQVLVVAFDMVCYRALGYLLKLLCIDTWLYFLCASDFPSTNQENVLRFSKSFSLWDLHSATFMGSRRKARDLKIWNIPCNAELGKHINFIIREQLCFDSWKSNMEVLKQRNMVFSVFRPLRQNSSSVKAIPQEYLLLTALPYFSWLEYDLSQKILMAISVPWKELVPLHQTHLSLGHD